MSKITVTRCAFHHESDINPDAKVDSGTLDSLMNLCVVGSTNALETFVPAYDEMQRYHLSRIFSSMQMTHATIRVVLEKCPKPQSVDSLVLARLQMEGLYTICLLLEDAGYVNQYLKDGWRKKYVSFLLQKEETKDLSRFDDFSQNLGPLWLEALRNYAGVTEAQQPTAEFEELGTPLPVGTSAQKIVRFPTPGGIIDKLPVGDKKNMLERLYPEYQYLSSFAHGLAESSMLRTMFDRTFGRNSRLEGLWPSESKMEDTYRRLVVEPAFSVSFHVLSSQQPN